MTPPDAAKDAAAIAEKWRAFEYVMGGSMSARDRLEISCQLASDILALVKREVERERERCCIAIRSACTQCVNGVFEPDPRTGDPVECEYCGRPIAAIRSRTAKAGEENK